MESKLDLILARLSAIELKIASGSGGSSGAAPAASASNLAPSVEKFDAYLEQTLVPFVAACTALGGECSVSGDLIAKAWISMRSFLLLASECKAPTDSELMALLVAPGCVAEKIKAVTSNTRRGDHERHCKAMAEAVGAVNWLCVKPAPVDVIESSVDGFNFVANKLRVEFKGKDEKQIAFCDAGKALFGGLVEYVKNHHKAGLKWNPKSTTTPTVDALKAYIAGLAAPAPAVAAPATVAEAAAPPAAPAAAAQAPKADTAQLFSSLSKGLDVTAGLKHVTKDMKSKNLPPSAAPVAERAAPAPRVNNNKPKGPPKCELGPDGMKWQVENQDGNCTVEISNMKQMVYIYGCIGATITVKGKCKSITIDNCQKCKVYFDEVFASAELVNCKNIHVGIGILCASLALDKVDGATIFVPATSMDLAVTAAKISEINLQWNDKDGELVEKPVPEQYVHRIKDGAVTVATSDLYSA